MDEFLATTSALPQKKNGITTNLEAVYTTVTSIFLFAWDHMKNRIKLSWLSFDSVPAHTN